MSYASDTKLDDARVQVHREGAAVRVFTRKLHDVTACVPELVEPVRALSVRAAVLDMPRTACSHLCV